MNSLPQNLRPGISRVLGLFPEAGRAMACLALGSLALVPSAYGQATPAAQPPAASSKPAAPASSSGKSASKVASIKSFRIVQEKDGPALEILATRPLVPAIQQISDPYRLVIDLPNARLDAQQKRVSVQSGQISSVRADQFQSNPPVARVVIDLLAPRAYTWDAAGNRLVVHLGKNPGEVSHSPFEPPTVASLAPAPAPVVKAVRGAGPLALASKAGEVGSSYTAGLDTAVLRLSSGGEVRVCPGTTVSITPSQNRHNLMLGMNTGALEAHMSLDASTDAIMTPDFRVSLVGPGEFHYAFSADPKGNTCVRALPGNTASAIVTELLGDRTYQVKATDQLVFRGGQLDHVDTAVPLECGCPPPRQAMDSATNDLPEQSSSPGSAPARAQADSSPPAEPPPAASAPALLPSSTTPQSEPQPANELHVQVTAPLVFRPTGPPPAPVEDVRALPVESRRESLPDLAAASAPPAAVAPQVGMQPAKTTPQHRGFFRRLGGFFAAIFH